MIEPRQRKNVAVVFKTKICLKNNEGPVSVKNQIMEKPWQRKTNTFHAIVVKLNGICFKTTNTW